MLAFAYKLAMCAEGRWHHIRGVGQLDQVVRGIKFQDGMAMEESAGRAA
jgi:hypothetical protein